MRRLCGFILFWMGIGIAIGIYIDFNFWILLMISAMLIIGFNMFCS